MRVADKLYITAQRLPVSGRSVARRAQWGEGCDGVPYMVHGCLPAAALPRGVLC